MKNRKLIMNNDVNLFDRLLTMTRNSEEKNPDVEIDKPNNEIVDFKTESPVSAVLPDNHARYMESQKIDLEDKNIVVKSEPFDDDEQLYEKMMSCGGFDKSWGRSGFELAAEAAAREDEKRQAAKSSKSSQFGEEPFELNVLTRQKVSVALTTLIPDYIQSGDNYTTEVLKIPKELSGGFPRNGYAKEPAKKSVVPVVPVVKQRRYGRPLGSRNKPKTVFSSPSRGRRTFAAKTAAVGLPAKLSKQQTTTRRRLVNESDVQSVDDVLKIWDAKVQLQVACGFDANLNKTMDQVVEEALKVINRLHAEQKALVKSTKKLICVQFASLLRLSGVEDVTKCWKKSIRGRPPRCYSLQKSYQKENPAIRDDQLQESTYGVYKPDKEFKWNGLQHSGIKKVKLRKEPSYEPNHNYTQTQEEPVPKTSVTPYDGKTPMEVSREVVI